MFWYEMISEWKFNIKSEPTGHEFKSQKELRWKKYIYSRKYIDRIPLDV